MINELKSLESRCFKIECVLEELMEIYHKKDKIIELNLENINANFIEIKDSIKENSLNQEIYDSLENKLIKIENEIESLGVTLPLYTTHDPEVEEEIYVNDLVYFECEREDGTEFNDIAKILEIRPFTVVYAYVYYNSINTGVTDIDRGSIKSVNLLKDIIRNLNKCSK